MSSDIEYEIDDGEEDFIVQDQEIVITNDEEEDEEEDDVAGPPGVPYDAVIEGRHLGPPGDDAEEDDEEEDGDSSSSSSSGSSNSSSSDDDDDDDEESQEEPAPSPSPSPKLSPIKVKADTEPMPKLKITVKKDLSRSNETNQDAEQTGQSILYKVSKNENTVEEENNAFEDEQSQSNQAFDQKENQEEEQEEVGESDQPLDDTKLDENGVYLWPEFVGAKVKPYTAEEYQSFQKPFQLGWKREVVLRGTSTVEKKAGDVYYHSPDGKLKLRSYVEMTNYVKRHSNLGLVAENFTFAKQPVWRPPDEIVRQAMQRGTNHVDLPFFKKNKSTPGKPTPKSIKKVFVESKQESRPGSGQEAEGELDGDSLNESSELGFGRGKRRRVLPSRYDDNEFEVISQGSASKKVRTSAGPGVPREALSNGNSQDSINASIKSEQSTTASTAAAQSTGHSKSSKGASSSSISTAKMTPQERRRTLQQQLYQQIHEEEMRRQKEEEQRKQKFEEQSGEAGAASGGNADSGKSLLAPISSKAKGSTKRKTNVDENVGEMNGQAIVDANNAPEASDGSLPQVVTCGPHCPNRRGMLPNLMCSRCFCLFHLECVPEGIFLKDPPLFICPNCLTPDDKKMKENEENGVVEDSVIDDEEDPMEFENTPGFVEPEVQLHSTNFGENIPKTKSLLQQIRNGGGQLQSLLKGGSSLMANGTGVFKPMKHFNGVERRPKIMHGKMNGSGMSLIRPDGNLNGFGMNERHRMTNGIMKSKHKYTQGFYNLNFGKTASSASSSVVNQYQSNIGQILRVAQTPTGHSVVIKDKSITSVTNSKGPDTQMLMRVAKQLAKEQYQSTITNGPSSVNHLASNKTFEDKFSALLSADKISKSTSGVNIKYQRYLARKFSVLNAIEATYSIGVKIAQYLETKDILNLRQTNRFWHQALPANVCSREIHLRGMTISDWKLFAEKIVSTDTFVLNFEGVRIPMNIAAPSVGGQVTKTKSVRMEKVAHFWKGMEAIYAKLGSIEKLKFGTVPVIVLKSLAEYAQTQRKEDNLPEEASEPAWPKLRTLSVLNLIDHSAELETRPSSLEFFSTMKPFKQLQQLKLDSKFGLKLPNDLDQFLATLCEYKNLAALSLPSLKEATCEQFSKIFSQLNTNKVNQLELGSCADWFVSEVNNDESLTGLFDQLSKFSNVTQLRLCDLVVGVNADPLVQLFESLIIVEQLTLDNLTIDPTGLPIWNSLKAIFKSLPLYQLKFSTVDPETNRAVFDVCRELVTSQKRSLQISWTATVNINDAGHCFVPISIKDEKVDFLKKYFANIENLDKATDQLVISREEKVVAVEISTLGDLLNRDVNLNQLGKNEPKVYVQILPQ